MNLNNLNWKFKNIRSRQNKNYIIMSSYQYILEFLDLLCTFEHFIELMFFNTLLKRFINVVVLTILIFRKAQRFRVLQSGFVSLSL